MLDDDEDDWPRVRMGRFSDADERIVKGVMGKRFRLPHATSTPRRSKNPSYRKNGSATPYDGSLFERAHVIENGYGHATGKEVVIKVRSRPKSDRGVQALLHYIARLRPEDKGTDQYGTVSMRDEFGAPLSNEDIHAIPERWDLDSERENLSPTARRYLENGDHRAIREMDERERLQHIQAWHFVLSIADDGTEEGVERKLQSAVRVTVDRAFTARGHKVAWGIHRGHTDHLHAHVVVKAQSEFGGRLHSDIHGDWLHALRRSFADNLKRTGLDYHATRRVDRRADRERIMAGHEPLNDNPCPWRTGEARRDPYADLQTWPHYFGEQAVENMERLEEAKALARKSVEEVDDGAGLPAFAGALRKALDEPPQEPSWLRRGLGFFRRNADNDDVPAEYRELFGYLKMMYHDPMDALASWQCMALDGACRDKEGRVHYPHRSLANWTLRHRPEYLGCVKADAYVFADDRGLRNVLRKAWLPHPQRESVRPGYVNVFMEYRDLKRVHKDRAKVRAELMRLVRRYRKDWPGTWLGDVTEQALHRAKRIEIGQQLPEIKAPVSTEHVPNRNPHAGGPSTSIGPERDEGTFLPETMNKNEAEQDRERAPRPNSRPTRKTGRGRSR